MKKVFCLEDLDCAHCAQKIEDAIGRIDGVESAAVSFFALKLTICAPEEKFPEIMKKAVKVCRRIEPACRIVL